MFNRVLPRYKTHLLRGTLVYRIDVHARLLILRKKSPLHGFILVCTFIDFEKKFPPCTSFPSCTFIGNWHVCMNIHHAKSNLKYVLDKHLVIKYKKLSFEGVGWDQVSKNGLIQSLTLFSRNFSPCTFIDFPESFPPVRLFCPARLIFLKNFPTCTFIPYCTSIRYTRLPKCQQNWRP